MVWSRYTREAYLDEGRLTWRDLPAESGDPTMLRSATDPFDGEGGLELLEGNVGRAIMKTSAVAPGHRVVEAPARVFSTQEDVVAAFRAGELDRDVVVVVGFQGPVANGMPELHQLTPSLSVLQDRGFHVALVTDGRMSGASGRIPAAIHVTPECAAGGPLARLRDGDVIRVDGNAGTLEAKVEPGELAAREPHVVDLAPHHAGLGRELFAVMRSQSAGAEEGAASFGWPGASAPTVVLEPAAP